MDVLASGVASAMFQRPSINYTYDDGDRLLSRSDANGHTTTFEYGPKGRLSTTRGPDGIVVERRTYTDGGYGTRKVTVRDARLEVAHTEHLDGAGRIWKQVAFDGTQTITDYDSRGRAFRATLPWGEVRTTKIQRAGLTTVSTSTQADVVAAITTTFDASGRPLRITDADGQVITNEYDLMGRLVATRQGTRELEHRQYDSVGRPVQVRSSGTLTCLTYDSFDNVVFEERGCLDDGKLRIDPEVGRGLVNVQRTYTNRNQLDTEIDGMGHKTDHTHDALGRLVATEWFDVSGTSRGKTQFSYDATGNQTQVTDELGYASRSEYDLYNRLTSSKPPGEGASTTTYVASSESWVATTTSPTGEVTSTSTDAMGRQWRSCGADNVCVHDRFANGLLVSRTRTADVAAPSKPTPVLFSATKYFQYHPSSSRIAKEWDWISNFETKLRCLGAVPDSCSVSHVERTWTAAGRPDTFVDTQGNLTAHNYGVTGKSLLLTGVRREGLPTQLYEYDATYPLLVTRRTVDPTGAAPDIVETTTWDRSFRPSRISRSNGSWPTETVALNYDAAGRQNFSRFSRGTESAEITETFDARNNPLSRAYHITTTAGRYAGTLNFTWRNNGQLEGVTYPSGNAVTYNYAAATGRLQTMTTGGAIVFKAEDYDVSGRARKLRFDDGAIRVDRTFDTAGREHDRRITGVSPAPRVETYTYDTLGRLETIAATGGAATTSVYGYDARDHLTSETHTVGEDAPRSFTYAYHTQTGLRSAKTDTNGTIAVTTDFSYDTGNRLRAVGTTVIPWDGYGRQTGDAGGRTFRWGLGNQLVAIDEAGTNVETAMHDAAGLRVARTTAAGGEVFLAGPAGELLERRTDDGATVEDYVRLPSGVVVATIDATGAVTPVLNSITGSPYRIGERSLGHLYQDSSGFGETMVKNGTLEEPLTFHQMFSSQAEGILVAGVRAYDVTTGRFLSPDPLGLGASPDAVRAADSFSYAQDNPIAMQDATGYAPCLQTIEGGCRSNLGEQGSEEERYAMVANSVADQRLTANLQQVANKWWADKDSNPWAATATDGQQVEQSNSIKARSPDKMEKSSEPKNPKPRISSGMGRDRSDSGPVRGEGRNGAFDSVADPVSDEEGATSGDSVASGTTSVVVCVDPSDPACAPRTSAGPRWVNPDPDPMEAGHASIGSGSL